MKKALLRDKSSLTVSGSDGHKSTSQLPTVKQPSILTDKGSEPENAHVTHTHTGAGRPPSSSQTPAPAQSCSCNTVIAERPGYVDEDGEEHDMEVYYRRCEVHDPDGKDPWAIDSLGDIMKLTNTTLTKEGRAYWRQLRRESDEKNPYIVEMKRVGDEIQRVEDELKFMGVAKEKIKDWNMEDQFSQAGGRERVPFPEYLEKYRDTEKFYETRKALEAKRARLYDEKFELHLQIINWRYQINQKEVLA